MISVIVPVYNGSAYIERCINSITGSTFRDIEIIAVENGSTDNTWEVLEALAAGDSRIKPISTEIRGLSNARNIGIDHASGDWIAFVDADDYISPLMYERLAEAARTHGADLVLCDFAQGTEEHFDFTEANRPAEGCNAAEELTRDDYFGRSTNTAWHGTSCFAGKRWGTFDSTRACTTLKTETLRFNLS